MLSIWKNLLCYTHLIKNTYWEFHQRHDFNLSQTTVNNEWQRWLSPSTNHYQSFFDFKNVTDRELVARNAEYEALSYCESQPLENMDGVGRVGHFTVLNQGNDEKNTHAWLITVNHDQESLTISLRGTTMMRKEILSDLDIRTTSLPCYMFPKSCVNGKIKVHHGFLGHFLNFGEEITNLISIYQNQYPEYATILTSHSLGAATGVLLLRHWLETSKIKFDAAYMYGLPIVGNKEFADTFISDKVVKVVNENDIVPTLGYIHGHHINGHSIWSINNTISRTLNIYEQLDCQKLSWYSHSILFGIQINDNYCKLNVKLRIEKVRANQVNESSTLVKIAIAIGFIIILLFISVVLYMLYSNLKREFNV